MTPDPVRVVAGVIRQEGRLLLCHRRPDRDSYPDVWDLPGGHLEPGESIAECLVRELEEELGITVDTPSGVAWAVLPGDDVELHIFLIDRWEGQPFNRAVEEHDDIRWFVAEDLDALELADPSYVELLRRAMASQGSS